MLWQWGLWAGLGLCSWSDHTAPACFLLLPPVPGVGWSPCCDSAWYNFPGKSMQRTIKLLDPFCSPSRGPVQARLCLGVARTVWIQVPTTIVGCSGGANIIVVCLFACFT